NVKEAAKRSPKTMRLVIIPITLVAVPPRAEQGYISAERLLRRYKNFSLESRGGEVRGAEGEANEPCFHVVAEADAPTVPGARRASTNKPGKMDRRASNGHCGKAMTGTRGRHFGNLFPGRCDNRIMRFAFSRAAVLVCVCALAGLAQQLTVEKVVEFVTSSVTQKLQDKDVAAYLTNVKLTQRLAPRTIEELQSKGAGPKTVAALNRLAEASATLQAPAPKVEAAKPKPLPTPPLEEQKRVIEAARDYALNYSKTLPDFICLQVTRRYLDQHYRRGTEGSWSMSDQLAEKLSYFDQHEKYEPISQNGNSLYGKPTEAVGGALSRGDFGTMLREIFDPASHAEFHWERWGNLQGHAFYVYTYAIDLPHSKETLSYDRSQEVTTAY